MHALQNEFQPIFLIAVPQLGDPNFAKSVVLIVHHDEDGAMGLVINNPTEITLGRFADSQGIICHSSLSESPIFRGGPVESERGWILHTDESVEEKKQILPGLFLSAGSETLRTLLEKSQKNFRLILGYAGWDDGQLEKEMVEGAWITTVAESKYVFETDPASAWNLVLNDLGVDPMRLMMGTGLH